MRKILRAGVCGLPAACCLLLLAQPPRRPLEPPPESPLSTIEFKSMPSATLGREVRYSVYLPASHADGKKRYPVIYFLHGLFEDEKRWHSRGGKAVADKLREEGKLGEIVIVIPDAGRTFYTNFKDGSQRYESFFVSEFIPHIESTYRVIADRAHRAVSGSSMGGYGALKYGMRHPDLFGAASAHSAVLIGELPENFEGRRNEFYKQILEGPFGSPIDRDYWNLESPLRLAEEPQKFRDLRVYFDCGENDRYGFFEGAQKLHGILESRKFAHEFHLFPGDHGWTYLQQVLDKSLLFHWECFNHQAATAWR